MAAVAIVGSPSALLLASVCACSVVSIAHADPDGASSDVAPKAIVTVRPSVARQWTDAALFAIRRDLARPTVHARNLYHLSAAMYDAWAVFNAPSRTLFLSPAADEPECRLTSSQRDRLYTAANNSRSLDADRRRAIGYAAWRLLAERYSRSSTGGDIRDELQRVATNQRLTAQVRINDTAAALGLKIAECIIKRGLEDGSNEREDYANRAYQPANPPMDPSSSGVGELTDPDRWQPLKLTRFIDQSGNAADAAHFIGAEWGGLAPFAMTPNDASVITCHDREHQVWLDPGPPPLSTGDDAAEYRDNFVLTALWSAHLDPRDGVMIDISPAVAGNALPMKDRLTTKREQLDAYDALEGGMESLGHAIDPATGQPYAANRVLRGDYTRVVAEFWADGPDSETPPGHWFRIYNDHVADHTASTVGWTTLERALGAPLTALDFDILAYLALGGAMHDSAIAAWSVKGAYDYVRPVTAVRFMASQGQSSDPSADNYSPLGLPLVPNVIGVVEPGDRLARGKPENIGQAALYAWRGPNAISDPATDTAGVGWILAKDWWPYQRPDFVTPAFAGYVSGHSTFSRAAAEVLERLTADAFFPGGIAEFTAPANEFLVFERGPSKDVVLQWATYRDAADQTSLSRNWGGIHPPADDLPGRRMGATLGESAWAHALASFTGDKALAEALANATTNASRSVPSEQTAMPASIAPERPTVMTHDHTPGNHASRGAEPAVTQDAQDAGPEHTLTAQPSLMARTARAGCASTSDSRA